jgi:hypothetical protein
VRPGQARRQAGPIRSDGSHPHPRPAPATPSTHARGRSTTLAVETEPAAAAIPPITTPQWTMRLPPARQRASSAVPPLLRGGDLTLTVVPRPRQGLNLRSTAIRPRIALTSPFGSALGRRSVERESQPVNQ